MSREVHAGICESRRVRLPPATRHVYRSRGAVALAEGKTRSTLETSCSDGESELGKDTPSALSARCPGAAGRSGRLCGSQVGGSRTLRGATRLPSAVLDPPTCDPWAATVGRGRRIEKSVMGQAAWMAAGCKSGQAACSS